jgi:hypothetical protein
MGYSAWYKSFTGMVEILSGALLLSRRTTTLGALVGIAAMTNVAMLDLCYDVGAKLFSCHLLLFMVILALPDWRRLVDLLLRNRATESVLLAPPLSVRWLKVSGVMLKTAVIGGFIYAGVDDSVRAILRPASAPSAAVSLEGVFDVRDFVQNDVPVPAWSDPKRWQTVTFTPLFGTIGIHLTNGDKFFYDGVIDAADGSLTITKVATSFKNENAAKIDPIVFKYVYRSPNELTLDGIVGDAHLVIRLHRSDLLLLSRGFHWINDGPFNR